MTGLFCGPCDRMQPAGPVYPPRCACGGLWDLAEEVAEQASPAPGFRVTPLWPDPVEPGLLWKREDLNPTGSFKDRGARILAEVAIRSGAERFVMDSSGSAALAAAAASARVGLALTIHAPAAISSIKRDASVCLGARLVAEGNRQDAAERAGREAESAFYLSHVHHPAFWIGTAQAAFEVRRQTSGSPPGTWVVPVGNGSLLLGLAKALRSLGLSRIRLTAVQSAACPGLSRPGSGGDSVASGIAIADPPRRGEILDAVARTGGEVLEVGEEEILSAWRDLWGRGVAAEKASAAALAGVRRLRASGRTEVLLGWLTGSGHRESEALSAGGLPAESDL